MSLTPLQRFMLLARDGRTRGSTPEEAAAWRLGQLLCDPRVALLLDDANFEGLLEFARYARKFPQQARELIAAAPRLPADAGWRPLFVALQPKPDTEVPKDARPVT